MFLRLNHKSNNNCHLCFFLYAGKSISKTILGPPAVQADAPFFQLNCCLLLFNNKALRSDLGHNLTIFQRTKPCRLQEGSVPSATQGILKVWSLLMQDNVLHMLSRGQGEVCEGVFWWETMNVNIKAWPRLLFGDWYRSEILSSERVPLSTYWPIRTIFL